MFIDEIKNLSRVLVFSTYLVRFVKKSLMYNIVSDPQFMKKRNCEVGILTRKMKKAVSESTPERKLWTCLK